jgi:hypothetical protein
MRIILFISFLLLFLNYGFGQVLDSIKEFTWTNSLEYLPSGKGEKESISYNKNRIKRHYSKTKHGKKLIGGSTRKLNKKRKDYIIQSFQNFISSKKQSTFTIELTQQDKDSLIDMAKQRSYYNFPLYTADKTDLMKYISNTDIIKIELSEFNTPYSANQDSLIVVIGGVRFVLTLEIISHFNDTIRLKYDGNLYDGVRDIDVPDFLSYYSLYRRAKLFENTPMDRYYTRKNLFRVILKYIAYKEDKIDRSNGFK